MAGWQFWIDRGDTVTGIVARDPAGPLSTRGTLPETPQRRPGAAVAPARPSRKARPRR